MKTTRVEGKQFWPFKKIMHEKIFSWGRVVAHIVGEV